MSEPKPVSKFWDVFIPATHKVIICTASGTLTGLFLSGILILCGRNSDYLPAGILTAALVASLVSHKYKS